VGKCTVMMQTPLIWLMIWSFLMNEVQSMFQNVKVECLLDCLFWRNEHIMDNSFDIKKRRSALFLYFILTFTLFSVSETL